jgi:phosphate transport system protein
MVHSRHTTKVFDSDLQELARAIAEMGGLAERQIAEAIEALTTRESAPARRIVAADATIDAMQRNIEKRAVETHCTPAAGRWRPSGDCRHFADCK